MKEDSRRFIISLEDHCETLAFLEMLAGAVYDSLNASPETDLSYSIVVEESVYFFSRSLVGIRHPEIIVSHDKSVIGKKLHELRKKLGKDL